jgi:hypothetical protein
MIWWDHGSNRASSGHGYVVALTTFPVAMAKISLTDEVFIKIGMMLG